jgi:hypothetical protein
MRLLSAMGSKAKPEGAHLGLFASWAGAKGRNRTADTAIFSRMLYRLSYLGVVYAEHSFCLRSA